MSNNMSNNTLPIEVVEIDHALEKISEKASEALAKHRWHWTLDETNPWRVGFTAYGRAVGRAESTIRKQVRGYTDWVRGETPNSLADCIERAGASELQRQAAEAVAEAQGVHYGTVRKHYPDDLRRVRDAIEDAEERQPDITPDEKRDVAKRTATNIVKSRQIARDSRERLQGRKSALAVMIEGELGKARYALFAALNYTRDVDPGTFPSEFRDQIEQTLSHIDALVQSLRSALGGAADIDWDAELQKLAVE